MRGGLKEAVSIKYEKLPLFCNVCWKLDHGEKDYDDDGGEGSVHFSFGDYLCVASPWKTSKGASTVGVESKGCAKKLFVVKKDTMREKVMKEGREITAQMLNVVSLNNERQEVRGDIKRGGGHYRTLLVRKGNSVRGFDPSYVWRSIWGAKSIVLDGLKWRVGDGHSINVWDEVWLLGDYVNVFPTPNVESPVDLRVADLIDSTHKCWNLSALQQHLMDEDTLLALSLLVSICSTSDLRVACDVG
uniref:Uncharacterized protein n=1 Tax=Chenopodium quinoa TaxID=63459 RepID=A0A803N9Z0_CHEQI